MNFLNIPLLISCLCSLAVFTHSCRLKASNGTTKNIEAIFKGRCYYFLNLRHSINCDINLDVYNCSKIWKAFESAVVGKVPCNIKMEDYQYFLSLVNHSIPTNSTLFWSGTYKSAQDCMKKDFILAILIMVEIITHLDINKIFP